MKTLFSKIAGIFTRIFSRDTAARIQRGLEAAAPYLSKALEVVETIAAITPNRTDDEIAALLRRYALPMVGTPADRATLLRDVALQALRREFPGAADRQLVRAIEVAYGALKP